MTTSLERRASSRRRSLAAAAIAFTLVLLSIAEPPALGQQSPPPDDAPPEGFPAGSPSSGEAPSLPIIPQPAAPPMIGGGIWLAEGPGPAIFGQVEAISPGPNEVSGAVHTVAAHPSDPDILYAGGANGGIWKTTDATSTSPRWMPLTDSETSPSIGALEFDPTDATSMTLVAGIGRYSAFGTLGGTRTGLLRTTDGGVTWTAIDGTGAIAGSNISGVAPRGSTLVASANTADPVGGFILCSDIGVFRSTDTGTSFPQVVPPAGPAGVAFDLAGDPANPSTLYTAMTFVGSTCSLGSGLTNGVYKSTDTGLTWTKVSTPAMDALIIDDLPPGSPGTNNVEIAVDGTDVYVDIIQSGRPVGIFYSPDAGGTWGAMDLPRTPEGAPVPIAPPDLLIPGAPIVVDHSPSGLPHGLSSGMEVEVTGVLGTLGANGVWTISVASSTTFSLTGSSDFTPWVVGSGTWTKVVGLNPKVKPGSQGAIHASIRVDPFTGTTVYLGGDRQDSPFPNFIGALDFSGRLFRGDATVPPAGTIPSPQWEHLTHWSVPLIPGGGTLSGSAPHADSREMVFDAGEHLIEGNDGGIYRRTSPASNNGDWFSINGNIQVTEIHDVAYDSLSDVILGGNQDTGTTQQQTAGGSLTWDSIHTADGGDVAIDDISVPGVSTRYSSFQFLGSFRRREYDPTNSLLTETFPTLLDMGSIGGILTNFVTPVELNAVLPGSLVLGGCNAVFESFDKGATIIEVPGLIDIDCFPPVMTFPQNAMAYGGISGAVPNPDLLYVGSGPSLYLRTTAGGSLTFVSAYPGTATIRDVVIDPADWMTAAVVESNLSGGTAPGPPFFSKVWWTTDAGFTWSDITGNLTDPGLQSAAYVPGPPDRLMVGGRDGVFELTLPPTLPGGPFNWGEIGTGLPNVPVWDMEWDSTDSKLVVGTLGRGAWSLQENGACGKPDVLVVRNQWVAGTQLDEACTRITGGPALDVNSGGDLEFKSPTIVLRNGFAVKTNGEFTVENAVP